MARIITKLTPSVPSLPAKLKVAAYARVSGGKDSMLQSLAAQVSYYSSLIQQRPDWEYAGVYADEALTGTKENRPEFQRMLSDSKNGKIDRIITKSISRFARNTVTLLETVRELKLLGVDVYFEEQNIHSISSDGELMLTILASYAQEESLSASENCKWRIRKRFENGELAGLNFMFGYRIRKGVIEIDPEQAEIVRMIFEDYISGMGGSLIARKLRGMKVPTIFGGKWDGERVAVIIKNEKYAGNALLQKKFVEDHLSKKEVRNKGQLPQYYAEGTHPAIIDTATFEKAKEIMEKRRLRFKTKDTSKNRYPFSSILRCVNCGKSYKRKVRDEKSVWQCSTYLEKGKASCHAKQIPEPTLYTKSAEVLGIYEFDTGIFKEEITQILVPEFNRLVFVFSDGRTVEKVWQDKSRRESWTEEMRQEARMRVKGGCQDGKC
ncbi:MAG: recombinase family protein [Thermincola sp.]|jgi:DNA invertase Pin-like site-specific DNA recombinase|nr:recombinase family protein [Thermincola sp.]MDT3704736.1 recombinase family protein [Thermincola sp.]